MMTARPSHSSQVMMASAYASLFRGGAGREKHSRRRTGFPALLGTSHVPGYCVPSSSCGLLATRWQLRGAPFAFTGDTGSFEKEEEMQRLKSRRIMTEVNQHA
jgi:hypothetical protein